MSAEPTYPRIVDAYHEWDDPDAFRVYLVRETAPGERDEGTPMEAVLELGDAPSVEGRLYRAAFVACPKDIGRRDARDRVLGFAKEAPAKRVASAVKKELARIAKGEPGPSLLAMQIAILMAKK